ncbi:hypothetical protein ACFQ51_31805 [Streptomyces kaempferi]
MLLDDVHAQVGLPPPRRRVVARVRQGVAQRRQRTGGLPEPVLRPLQPGEPEEGRDTVVGRGRQQRQPQTLGAQGLEGVAQLLELADEGTQWVREAAVRGPAVAPRGVHAQVEVVQRPDQRDAGDFGQALLAGEAGPGEQRLVRRIGAEERVVEIACPSQQLGRFRARLGHAAQSAPGVEVRLAHLQQQRQVLREAAQAHQDGGEAQFVGHGRLGLVPQQVPQQRQVALAPVELGRTQRERAARPVPGHLLPRGARPQQRQVGAAPREDRLPQRRTGVRVQEVVGTALLGAEQQEVGLGPRQGGVQQADELHGRALGQAESGPQLAPFGVDPVGLPDPVLRLGDRREDPLLPVGRREPQVVVPAGQPDQHLQCLVHAVADDSGRALGVRVQHGSVPAHEVRSPRVVARYRLQWTAGGEPYVLGVLRPVEVEGEGERGQFGQAGVLPQQTQSAIGHVTERNSRHRQRDFRLRPDADLAAGRAGGSNAGVSLTRS